MYMVIDNETTSDTSLSLAKICFGLSVSRSGYYDWKRHKNSGPSSDPYEMTLRDEIQKIVIEFTGYGYRRVTKELHRRGYPINAKHALRLMREDNLLCLRKRLFKSTTDSNHQFPIFPNLAKGMSVTKLNQLWVADITYIRIERQFLYLAVIIDVFSRKCIGWELDWHIDTQLTLNALNKALASRRGQDLGGLIHHSDQGVQYASHAYIDRLKAFNIRISMSRKGNPYDNAYAESFIKTLKYEEVYLSEYSLFSDAYNGIGKFIQKVYNRKRLHSGIGYVPPDEFEEAITLNNIS